MAIEQLNKPIPFCNYCSEDEFEFNWEGYHKNDLDVYQYTDIALYISGKSDDQQTNTVTEFYIDNIRFNNLETGSPSLYYKNLIV